MAEKSPERILRIGIIQSGKIVEERLMRRRTTVTIGTSPNATFIVPSTSDKFPKAYPVFNVQKGQYFLSFSDDMKGKVSIGGDMLELDELRKSGKAHKSGKNYQIPITDSSRGKVSVGDATLLYNFVAAPPIPPKPRLPASIRGGWVKSIDWVFAAVVVGSFLAHSALFGAAAMAPTPKKMSLEKVPERFAKFVVEKMPEPEPPEEEVVVEEEGVGEAVQKEEPKKAEKAEPKKQMSDEQRAAAEAERRRKIAEKVSNTGLLQLLTAKGPGGSNTMGALVDTLSDGQRMGSISDAMEGVSKLAVADDASNRARRGIGSGGAAGGTRDVGNLDVAAGGGKTTTKKAEKKVTAKMSSGRADIIGTFNQSSLKRTIRRYEPSIRSCYEQELRRNPNLSGKVYIDFTIGVTGKVTRASVGRSSLKSRAVESCIVARVKGWRFPKPPDGEVEITYPIVFSAAR